ncbi:hypothetical protein BACCAP_01405 [Pseudoflavonifractor capillosus ATCC 29799]|uniref:Uncharacterized protein n=1 Tax=Pseudoflavonifractor capillosus ATCC 29799 TaxID=411467 RepID=A6NT76_9FIRM|nr:hypothetical protein BACCAP_01405 [Pseudoflavonifractor capillosus ATCC 29799]
MWGGAAKKVVKAAAVSGAAAYWSASKADREHGRVERRSGTAAGAPSGGLIAPLYRILWEMQSGFAHGGEIVNIFLPFFPKGTKLLL